MEFVIPEVSPALVMDVCKYVTSAPSPIDKSNLLGCFKVGKEYVNRAVKVALQLHLLEETQGKLTSSQRWRDTIRKAHKEELYLPFRGALQDYPPFLVYADLLSKGYDSSDAAFATRGIFAISSSPQIAEKTLRWWGLYSKTIEQDVSTKKLRLTIDTEKLLAEYVKALLESLESDFKAKIFIVDRLTTELFAYLTTKNISIQQLVDSLRGYEQAPAECVNKASKLLELYLYKIGEDNNIDVTKCRGIGELADTLRQKTPPLLLKNQLNICHGLSAVRNVSSHGVDPETGKEWKVNTDAALGTILLIPITMRSIHLYVSKKMQEF
jgi:hypothetical protein